MAVAVEDLDAVVLRRVVGRGHDEAEILGEQRNGRRREDPPEDGDTARRRDPGRQRLLERDARGPRVTSDEDTAAT